MNRHHVQAGWVSDKFGRLDERDRLVFDKPRVCAHYLLAYRRVRIAQVSFSTQPNALAA